MESPLFYGLLEGLCGGAKPRAAARELAVKIWHNAGDPVVAVLGYAP